MLKSFRIGLFCASFGLSSGAYALDVSFVLTLNGHGPERFTDGYPNASSAHSAERRLLSVRDEVALEFLTGNVIRIHFKNPVVVRTDAGDLTSTLIFPRIDLRFSLAPLAAVVTLQRLGAPETIISLGTIDFNHLKRGQPIDADQVLIKFRGRPFSPEQFNKLHRAVQRGHAKSSQRPSCTLALDDT